MPGSTEQRAIDLCNSQSAEHVQQYESKTGSEAQISQRPLVRVLAIQKSSESHHSSPIAAFRSEGTQDEVWFVQQDSYGAECPRISDGLPQKVPKIDYTILED